MTRPDHRRRSTARHRSTTGRGPAAVVVGLDNITGLQTARILADRGVRVYGVAANRRHFGARTNACIQVVESPLSGPALVDTLRRLAPKLGPERAVLVPCTDGAVWSLSLQRDQLLDRLLPTRPDDDVALLAIRCHPQRQPAGG